MRAARSHTSPAPNRGFTMIEIMIVITIMGMVVAIAAPNWIRQRNLSQQRTCQENLLKLSQAKEQWAMETRQGPGATPTFDDLYVEDGTGVMKTLPICPTKGTYSLRTIGQDATCTVTEEPYNHNAIPFANTGDPGD